MIIIEASDACVLHVFRRLRADRVIELTATAWHEDAELLAADLLMLRRSMHEENRRTWLYALAPDEKPPVAIVGIVPFGPGIGGMIWASIPEWEHMVLPSHRWWRDCFVPFILERYYRRVEFTALASDHASRRWLKTLGFTEEGTAYRQGKRGEDFIHCAWLNPDPTVGIQSLVSTND
jgi:hypothetical protein